MAGTIPGYGRLLREDARYGKTNPMVPSKNEGVDNSRRDRLRGRWATMHRAASSAIDRSLSCTIPRISHERNWGQLWASSSRMRVELEKHSHCWQNSVFQYLSLVPAYKDHKRKSSLADWVHTLHSKLQYWRFRWSHIAGRVLYVSVGMGG